MVTRNQHKRLARLEAQHAADHPEVEPSSGARELFLVLIAYHIGGMQPGETLQTVLERAFGLKLPREPAGGSASDTPLWDHPACDTALREALCQLITICETRCEDGFCGVNPALNFLFRMMPPWCQTHPRLRNFDLEVTFDGGGKPDDDCRRKEILCEPGIDPIRLLKGCIRDELRSDPFQENVWPLVRNADPTYCPPPSPYPEITSDMSAIEASEIYDAMVQRKQWRAGSSRR